MYKSEYKEFQEYEWILIDRSLGPCYTFLYLFVTIARKAGSRVG
jgi:hypothetical protein